jgi:hypothetical protein
VRYWIGGGSGAGKSTVAAALAARHGLVLYATDAVMAEHARRLSPAEAPYLAQFVATDMDQRWLDRSPSTMLETFHWFRGEGFHLIVEDLQGLPSDSGVVVEGFRLLPHLVAPRLDQSDHAVWLLPTPEFRRAAFDHRGDRWRIAGQTSDPPRALDNLLVRDAMFTDRVAAEVAALGLPRITVDPSMTETDLIARVETQFGL